VSGALTVRVRFAETDQMGIAHHGAYVIWLEAARIEWLRWIGLSYRALEDEGYSLAVSAIDIVYRSAARFDDLLSVQAIPSEIRSRRVAFRYRVVRPSDGTLLATGSSLHTPTDRRGVAVRLPDRWLSELSAQRDKRVG
jgi:acyl-CoA thioester hydrolase